MTLKKPDGNKRCLAPCPQGHPCECMDHIEESDQNWSEVVEDLKSQLIKLQSKLEFYKRRADHNPNSPFNKIANAVDKKLRQLLDEQKKAGKKFISDEEVDKLMDKIIREELGNDTGRS